MAHETSIVHWELYIVCMCHCIIPTMDSLILPFVCLPFQSIKQPNRLWLDVVWSCLQGRYGHEASCRTHEWKIGHVRCRWNCHSIDHQWTRIPLCVKIQRSNVWFLSHSFHKCRNVIQTSIMLLTFGRVFDPLRLSRESNGPRNFDRTWTIWVLLVMFLCMMKWPCNHKLR